jgi:flagellar motor protein MotB
VRRSAATAAPGSLLAIAHAAGNRAATRAVLSRGTPRPRPAPSGVVMRYTEPTTEYELGRGDGAGTPFTLNADEVTVMPRTSPDAPGLGIGAEVTRPDKPPLLVSDDGTMAINSQKGEPREFYATQAVIDASNARLLLAGSPVELVKGGNTITVAGFPTPLEMVRPALRDGPPPDTDQFISLKTTICRDVAKNVMGRAMTYAKLGGRRIRGPMASGPTVVTGTHEVAEAMTEGKSAAEAGEGLASGTEAGRPLVGKQYGTALGEGDLDAKAREYGVNQYAKADIGEAYTTQRIENEGEALGIDYAQGGERHEFTWGYHFAAVVAQSAEGKDQITLENYNRSGDYEEGRRALLERLQTDFADEIGAYLAENPMPDLAVDPALDDAARKVRENEVDRLRLTRIGEILHWIDRREKADETQAKEAYQRMHDERLADGVRAWYFRMVGENEGQSFHEQMAASGYFSNPLTMAVGGARASGTVTVSFTEASAVVPEGVMGVLRNLAKGFLADKALGHTTRLRVTGYSSGEAFGTAARKERKRVDTATARAQAVRQVLIDNGLDPGDLDTTIGVREEAWDAAQARRATVEVV